MGENNDRALKLIRGKKLNTSSLFLMWKTFSLLQSLIIQFVETAQDFARFNCGPLAVIEHRTPETRKARPLLVRKLSELPSEVRETHNRTG
jgi:hypothetical protein